MRHTGVINKPVMDEIEHSVANNGGDREPQIHFEAEYGEQQKPAGHHDFNKQRPAEAPITANNT